MFIAMNRFRIVAGRETAFEDMWRNRESNLVDVAGFRKFHLLRAGEDDGATLFVSHSTWDSKEAFEAWTNSDSFRESHAKARAPMGTYLGPPQFEGFEVVL